ncbi:hypothetical protein CBW46_004150 [Paenibacillus xerothermodurans]|uniref:Uncharacterized protein n=1 Tax=Paenibacillus xerothermodurans TaxID=1977292 RepID=A0A2W1NS56_PAEXE|nr:hypothetical protein CBW46_004150 [Paenibacillus xerothermodurans]
MSVDKLQRAWNEHGEGSFSFDVLEPIKPGRSFWKVWMNSTDISKNWRRWSNCGWRNCSRTANADITRGRS